MNKFWITTISAAGTVGSAGAAYAGVNVVDHFTASTSTATTVADASTSSVERTVQYQIGAAGTVTVQAEHGELKVVDVVAADGWSVLGATGPGTHVEVQFSDGTQVVTFGADWVDPDIAVTVTAAPLTTDTTVADTTGTTTPSGFDVSIISDELDDAGDHPHPGTPGTGVPTTSVPPASTTAPSGGGDDDDQDEVDEHDEHDDEHEVEYEDD